MSKISFDYNGTINQAKELENVASNLQNSTYKQIEDVIKNIEASWSGESEKMYVSYLNSVLEAMKKQITFLLKTAEYLRTSAQQMKNTENMASDAIGKIV